MESTIKKTFLFWIALATPAILHVTLLSLYAVNAPRLDDFSELLTFLPDWHAAVTSEEKWRIFFRDYQNHRYTLYHALLIAFDHVNFRTATFAGNISLLALCALLMALTRQHPQKALIWLMTPLLAFNLQSWRAMFWGPLGTTNLLYPVIALFACWLATMDRRGLVAAALVSIFLTLSHGSGPLLFPVIAVYLLMRYGWKSHAAMYWLALSALVLALYFLVFPLQGDAGYSSHASSELLTNLFSKTLLVLQGFFALLGGHLLVNDNSAWKAPLAMLIGASEFAWLMLLIRHGALRNYPALLLWLAFIVLTALSIASGRVAYAGIAQAMQGHYKLLNGMLLWLTLAATLDWLQHHPQRWQTLATRAAIGTASTLYIAAILLFLQPIREQQRALADDAKQWLQSGKLAFGETQLYVKQPNKKIKAAFDGGFYDPLE